MQDVPQRFAHWMLSEIYDQPEAIRFTLSNYVEAGIFRLTPNEGVRRWISEAKGDIVVAASGSSRHAGMLAELQIEEMTGLAVDVEYASEYCHRSERALKDASVLLISQSGETADTLAALRKAHIAGHGTLAVTNVWDSTIAQAATVSYPTSAGLERAVPATKSFTAQLLVLQLFALLGAEARGTLAPDVIRKALDGLEMLPNILSRLLPSWEASVREIASRYGFCKNFLFLGRGPHYPIAKEGALKLKESSYLHAEGYPCGELKHGPMALVSDVTPLVIIATVDHDDSDSILRYEKTLTLMKDMHRRGAKVLCLAIEGDTVAPRFADDVLFVPKLSELLLPFAEVIYFQLFAYFMAVQIGINVDAPRNLVKAVVVE